MSAQAPRLPTTCFPLPELGSRCRRLSSIGVFDSGVGGLGMCCERCWQPHTNVLCIDSANAPYGERGDAFWLRAPTPSPSTCVSSTTSKRWWWPATPPRWRPSTKRSSHPDLSWWGWSPPSNRLWQSPRLGMGVIGTRDAHQCQFALSMASLPIKPILWCNPAMGSHTAIERSVALPVAPAAHPVESTETGALCKRYVNAMVLGTAPGEMDTWFWAAPLHFSSPRVAHAGGPRRAVHRNR